MKKLSLSVLGFLFFISATILFMNCDNNNEENIKDPVTIIFETFGLIEIEPIVVERSSIINDSDLPKPVVEGYKFSGWYFDKDFGQTFSYSSQIVFDDIMLYGNFINQKYKQEVTNISHVQTGEVRDGIFIDIFWDNPIDDSFSHVNIDNVGQNYKGISDNFCTIFILKMYIYDYGRPILIKCVDKNGDMSKGVEYIVKRDTLNFEPYS